VETTEPAIFYCLIVQHLGEELLQDSNMVWERDSYEVPQLCAFQILTHLNY